MPRDVFIFVPAYNVGKTLHEVLSKVSPAMYARSQVLVIDDGSKEPVALEPFDGEGAWQILCHRFENNQGYGAVVKFGLAAGLAAGAKYIACLHGDGQYPAEKLDEFIAEMERRDCSARGLALLQGSRHAVAGGARRGGMPLYKRLGGAFLTALENVAFKQKLTDRHSGYIVYNAEFLKTLDLEKLSPSFDIDLEIISIADARGWRLAELPIPTRYAGEKSNLNVVTYGLRVLRQVVRRFFR
ncbi:MAG: glycosyltransferase family 2 protein [Fibrobacter sp.]|uniref:glycosyltransferase family 2 protein n=1 Tax=Fibrobacter sp. UWP2 TaxID=1896216 RepID=UPI00091D2182|nr:glycosyltransferase family 2 protein [Fibrobacter sp. UWP2]MBO7384186.1 glycosyltransferase family 2 protein [Fibrobacter sp.]SHI28906.1 Glycosyl transferase family 2 [Fibrobacter sp. UWP2]